MEKVFRLMEIKRIDTPKFVMSPIELQDYIDFDVKRVYFITEPKASTGKHCHLTEEEFFVMAKGTSVLEVDAGEGLRTYPLTAPQSAAYVPALVWHHFKDFSPDAVLVALSSTNYNPDRSDYIEDYEEFLRRRKAETGV